MPATMIDNCCLDSGSSIMPTSERGARHPLPLKQLSRANTQAGPGSSDDSSASTLPIYATRLEYTKAYIGPPQWPLSSTHNTHAPATHTIWLMWIDPTTHHRPGSHWHAWAGATVADAKLGAQRAHTGTQSRQQTTLHLCGPDPVDSLGPS